MPEPTTRPSAADLSAEDAKLVVLARAARGRAHTPHTGVAEGAAVRDADGRTYAAATVEHAEERLSTSAVRGALSAFASSGARVLEAAVVVTDRPVLCADDVALLAEFGTQTLVSLAGPDGVVRATTRVAALLAGSAR
jgi:cytidine deaminase